MDECYTGVSPYDAWPWMTNADVSKLTVYGLVLNCLPNPANLALQWKYNFILQSATNISGPYSDVWKKNDPAQADAWLRQVESVPVQ